MTLRRVAAAITVGLGFTLVAACSGGVHGYGNDTEGAFMESCAVKQQQPEAVCRCTYQEITQRIPFDSYVELDKELQKDPKAVPDELMQIVSDCASRSSDSSSNTGSSGSSNPNTDSSASSSSSGSSSTGSSSSSGSNRSDNASS
ncbi:MAG TPA: hypothetical protein VGJ03_15785 [Acidimicrobiales bacterium]